MSSWWENAILRQVILGVYDDKSSLSCLRGNDQVLCMILERVVKSWASHISTEAPGYMRLEFTVIEALPRDPEPLLVQFPNPLTEEIDGVDMPVPFHVNMMPFALARVSTLPQECKRYWPMIRACLDCLDRFPYKTVGYLTIHESWVEPNTTQRRGGLHVEIGGGFGGRARKIPTRWGGGSVYMDSVVNGIIMASNVANSCGVWNVQVEDATNIVTTQGDIEHLRCVLDKEKHGYTTLEENELMWITNKTPHESLPVPTRQFRQFFRLIPGNLSHWYADHSTPNPLGIKPDCLIVQGNKFNEESTVEFNPNLAPMTLESREKQL